MEEIIAHFASLTNVSPQLEQQLRQRIRHHQVPKQALIHQAGSICHRTYWIKQGLLRLYYLKEGKEVTDFFSAENQWITSAYSFIQNRPDQFYLQALEPSELYSLTGSDLVGLFEQFPEMERFGRIVITQQFMQQSERLNALQFASAAERYEHFCQAHQSILARLPLGMVASYLGITQETLSRIRAIF